MKRYSALYFSALLIVTSSITHIAGEPAETGIIEEESPVSSEEDSGSSMPSDTMVNSSETVPAELPAPLEILPAQSSDNPVAAVTERANEPDRNTLLAEGKSKKAAGAALLSVGAVFMGGALVYTTLFLIDQQTFGIPIGSTNDGYYRYDYYLNPGLFAVPVGAPCLALGIVNMIRGRNMINRADNPDEDSSAPVELLPYLSLGLNTGSLGTGLIARF